MRARDFRERRHPREAQASSARGIDARQSCDAERRGPSVQLRGFRPEIAAAWCSQIGARCGTRRRATRTRDPTARRQPPPAHLPAPLGVGGNALRRCRNRSVWFCAVAVVVLKSITLIPANSKRNPMMRSGRVFPHAATPPCGKGQCKSVFCALRMPRAVLRACPCQIWLHHRMLVPIR